MSSQQGSALVIVLLLLASSMILGVMCVQSALVDERLAGNFRASTQAQMRAEIAAHQALANFNDLDWESAPLVNSAQAVRFETYVSHAKTHTVDQCPQRSCLYIPVIYQGDPWVMALGSVMAGNANAPVERVAQSWPVFIRRENIVGGGTKTAVVWQ